MRRVDVCLERETANDEFAVVVKIYEASNKAVTKDQHIFDIENSKATQEVIAPASGILLHQLSVGDEVAFGVPLATVVDSAEAASTVLPSAQIQSGRPQNAFQTEVGSAPSTSSRPPSSWGSYPSRPQGRAPKFSRAALELMQGSQLAPSAFSTEWVTAKDVREHFSRTLSTTGAKVSPPSVEAKRPAMHKRTEIRTLSAGAGASMLSVLGVSLGKISTLGNTENIFYNRITDLVLYKSARLIERYRNLNSYFEDGFICNHEAVVAGLAIDGGGRLVVYGIENASRLELCDIRSEILSAISRYADHTLTEAELTRATFSVTDLSAQPLDFIFPLLPAKQSSIIGITRDAQAVFRLFVGFDHRVTEGREVAIFLDELSTRLITFDRGMRAKAAQCNFCEKTLAEEVHSLKNRGLIKVLDANGCEVYCCLACLGGW